MEPRIVLAMLLALAWPFAQTARGQAGCGYRGSTERVSVSSTGVQGDRPSLDPSISADGRYVAFDSLATNLVPGDTNGITDVFLHDRWSGSISRMSLRADGGQGYLGAFNASVSDPGPWVCFNSGNDLLPDDTNGATDIYVRNASTDELRRVSVSSAGVQGDSWSYPGVIAAGGRYVAFRSLASNLVPGESGWPADIFVHDMVTGTTEKVSVSTAGEPANQNCGGPAISPDGRFVLFHTIASNLVAGDTNGVNDFFLRDRLTGETEIVSVGTGGILGDGHAYSGTITYPGADITPDGRFVVFQSYAGNLVANDNNGTRDLFLRDRWADVTVLVSVGLGGTSANASSGAPRISADGRFVAFHSDASDHVVGDTDNLTDLFIRDLWRGETRRINLAPDGSQSAGAGKPSASADGLQVAFETSADDLVPGDTNGVTDIFVRSEPPPPPTPYCTAQANSQGCTPAIGSSGSPSASAGSGFWVTAAGVLNRKSGLLFYGEGSTYAPFQGGTLCVAPPLKRTAVQGSGGNPPPADCSGSFALDFNARISSGVDPALVAGRWVHAQYWSRDPRAGSGTNLTDAIGFWICL